MTHGSKMNGQRKLQDQKSVRQYLVQFEEPLNVSFFSFREINIFRCSFHFLPFNTLYSFISITSICVRIMFINEDYVIEILIF